MNSPTITTNAFVILFLYIELSGNNIFGQIIL